jgi:hypothetical protein
LLGSATTPYREGICFSATGKIISLRYVKHQRFVFFEKLRQFVGTNYIKKNKSFAPWGVRQQN